MENRVLRSCLIFMIGTMAYPIGGKYMLTIMIISAIILGVLINDDNDKPHIG